MKSSAVLFLCLSLAACATPGPRRQSVSESLAGAEQASPSGGPVAREAQRGAAPEQERASPSGDEQSAGPFSAGLMLGAGVTLDDGRAQPLQLAAASLKVAALGQRSVNVLALGGVSTSIPKDGEATPKVRGAWGVGAAVELTPGNLLYEVDAGVGVLWMTGISGPTLAAGFTISPKM